MILNKNTDTSFHSFFSSILLKYKLSVPPVSLCFCIQKLPINWKVRFSFLRKKANKYLYFIFPAEPTYEQIPEDQPSHPLSQPQSPPPYSDALEHLPYNPSYEPQPWAEDCWWPGESKRLRPFRLMFYIHREFVISVHVLCSRWIFFKRAIK